MAEDTRKVKYVSVIPKAAGPDTKFQTFNEETGKYDFHADFKLIRSLDELKEYAKKCKDVIIAVDTETTGLSYDTDFIVGFSVSLGDYDGIYVPLRHQTRTTVKEKVGKVDENGNPVLTKTGKQSMHTVERHTDRDWVGNLPAKEALDILFNDIMCNAKMNLLHNSGFDLNMLRKEGYDVIKAKTFDTMILSYIYDPEARMNGLKPLSEWVLGRRMTHFDEVTGGDNLFRFTNPEESYEYAACHDKETEVLTEKGWVLWEKYNGIDKLATVNVNNNIFEYQAPLNITKYKYKGKMMQYRSTTVDFCVTPNHNMLVYPAQNANRTAIWKKAEDLNSYEKLYNQPVGKEGGKEKTLLTTQGVALSASKLAGLTALVLADGYTVTRTKTHRNCAVCVTLSKDKHYKEISEFLLSTGLKWGNYRSSNSELVEHWTCHDKILWEFLHPYCGVGSRNKLVPQFIKDMPKDCLQTFIKYYGLTDGYLECNTQYLYTTSPKMRDDLMELLLMIGFRSHYHSRKVNKDIHMKDGRIIKSENCAPVFHISFNLVRKSIGIRRDRDNLTEIDYNDYVYCAEVPNHTLITRRGGRILISGNCDSACTFGLYKALYKPVLELLKKAPEHMIIDGKPYNIMKEDNNLIRAFVDYYDHCELKIDKNFALEYKNLIDKQTAETVEKVYSYFGKGVFSLSTGSTEFKTTMAEFNFETGARTKKGAVSYGKEGIRAMQRALNGFKNNIYPLITKIFFVDSKLLFAGKDAGTDFAVRTAAYDLAKFIFNYGNPYFKVGKLGENSSALSLRDLNNKRLNKEEFVNILNVMYEKEREKLNILQLIQNYTSLQKALNSYISKLTDVDSCRMKYRLTGTKSSRLSSGNGSKTSKAKNTYFSDLSAQTLSKPKSQWYEGRPATPEEMDKSILGWVFTPVSNEYYQQYSHEKIIVEGFKQEANIRSCIVAPKGRYIVSMDYGAEEIYVLAFLCQDSKQVSALRAKVDFHKQTALALFGEENYNVQARRKAKGCNFLMNYGGGPGTLSENLDISFEEAKDIIEKYQKTFHECMRWKQKEAEKMYNNQGLIFTKFGRPRQLKPWLDEARRLGDDGLNGYCERSVVSHAIQGYCGDICRFDMNKFYKQIHCNPEHRDHVDFLSFIHDELNTTVDKEHIEKYIRMLQDLMVFPYLDKELPLETGIEIGYRLGDIYPFTWNDPKTRDYLIPERSYFGD